MAKFDWEFVNIRLTSDDRPKLVEMLAEYNGFVRDILADVLELGYKVSASWIDDKSSYIVTVSGNDKTPDNNRQSVTSWSSDLDEAYIMSGYKVLVLAQGKAWKDIASSDSNWG